jgi:hypothetical protein
VTTTLRTADELQRAHDILASLVLDERMMRFVCPTLRDTQNVIATLNVLCWVLKHDHNPNFGEMIDRLEAALRELGVQVIDFGQLQPGRKPQ